MVAKAETLQTGIAEHEERKNPTQLAVLISNKGTGSNLQAIIDAIGRKEINCKVSLVVSDKSDALGLQRAEKNQIPWQVKDRKSQPSRDAYGKDLAETLNQKGVQVAVLAGFMTVLPQSYFDNFQGVTLNVHPGLIPDEENGIFYFPDGTEAPWNRRLMTDDAVKNFLGMKYAGSTVHLATEKTDFGPVLERAVVKVEPEDTVDTLYARLKPEEHKAFIRVLKNPPIKK